MQQLDSRSGNIGIHRDRNMQSLFRLFTILTARVLRSTVIFVNISRKHFHTVIGRRINEYFLIAYMHEFHLQNNPFLLIAWVKSERNNNDFFNFPRNLFLKRITIQCI